MSSPKPIRAWLARRRKFIVLAFLLLIAWRTWPLAAIFTGWNERGAIGDQLPEASFLPPATTPDEIRSGLSHPFFEGWDLAGEIVFLPRAMRHGHVFKRDDPALPFPEAVRWAAVLSDPSTYDIWAGPKMCGGFHADWYFRWGSGSDRHEVILCEGCQEVFLYHAGRSIRCDLTKAGYQRLEEITRTPGTR